MIGKRSASALALTAALASAGCGGSSGAGNSGSSSPAANSPVQTPTQLLGDVGHNDAFHISLTDQNGNAITNLKAGTYPLVINDESGIHNFHLTGGGVDKSTNVSSIGKQTFTVTFTPGTYTFVCDPHASQMHGSFKVSAG